MNSGAGAEYGCPKQDSAANKHTASRVERPQRLRRRGAKRYLRLYGTRDLAVINYGSSNPYPSRFRTLAHRCMLEQLRKLLNGIASLFDHRHERSTLKVAIMPRQRDAKRTTVWMLQDVMAPTNVVHEKSYALERPQYIFRLQRRKPLAHAISDTRTRISSFTGSLSEGIGR